MLDANIETTHSTLRSPAELSARLRTLTPSDYLGGRIGRPRRGIAMGPRPLPETPVPDAVLASRSMDVSRGGDRLDLFSALALALGLDDATADRLLFALADRVAHRICELEESQQRLSRPVQGTAIGPNEVAQRIGLSPQWVRENYRDLGGRRAGTGPKARYLFDAGAIDRWLQAPEPGLRKQPAPSVKRHRQAPERETMHGLLPYKTRA